MSAPLGEWSTGAPPPVPSAEWDRPLSREEVKELAPMVRGRRSRLSLARKAHALELAAALVAEGNAALPEIPHDRAKLRRLEDAARGLWEWRDPMVDHPEGRNRDLVARWSAALELVRVHARGGRGALKRGIEVRDHRIGVLEAQLAQLAADNRELRAALAVGGRA